MARRKKTPLTDLAIRQQVYLERLKAGYIRNYAKTDAELRQAIREVLVALEDGSLRKYSRTEFEKILIELREAHLGVTAKAMTGFSNDLPDLAAYASGLEVTSLASATGAVFAAPTARLAYQAALANPVQATGQMLADMIRLWPEADATRLVNVTRAGWARGATVQDMVRDLCGKKVRQAGQWVIQPGTGTELDISRRNAATVINTATQHTANAARQDVWERNNDIVVGYIWVSTLDRRTTQQCKSLDGRKFEAGKGPMPPIHPNCRSTTEADLGEEFEFLNEGRTRASSGPTPGYVDGDLTYYEWLKTQPADFQVKALGPQRAKLFRDGGLTATRFAELNLDRNFNPLTLAEMKELEPEAFKLAGL